MKQLERTALTLEGGKQTVIPLFPWHFVLPVCLLVYVTCMNMTWMSIEEGIRHYVLLDDNCVCF